MRASPSFMQSLRKGLDEMRVVRARDEGTVTARQADNALKFIRAAKAKPARPRLSQLVKIDSQFVGEIVFDGVEWKGIRHGSDYPNGQAFASEAEAYAFVVGAVAKPEGGQGD